MPNEVRELIRTMSRENPHWDAPRIHGELLKFGIDIGETSVSEYLVRWRKPPSQTWRTFLENHSSPGRLLPAISCVTVIGSSAVTSSNRSRRWVSSKCYRPRAHPG